MSHSQNDGPPPGMFPDFDPQSDGGGFGPPAVRQQSNFRGGNRRYQDDTPQFDVKAEMAAFMATLSHPEAKGKLKHLLPSNTDPDTFINMAKIAVLRDPDLLNPVWRQSLLLCLQRSAWQGIPPDGKHGALVVRYDDKAKQRQVCWQPMVWGIMQAGRLCGAVKTWNASIVYEGEPFDIEGGDEITIKHKIVPECVDAGLSKARAVYACITSPDGAVTRRWMSASRVLKVKASSRAARGPWNGPFEDEMWIKTILLYTMKWVETNVSDRDKLSRFKAALEQDLDVDFEDESHEAVEDEVGGQKALPDESASNKLNNLASEITRKQREKEAVPAGEGRTVESEPAKQAEAEAPETEPTSQPQPEAKKESPAPDQKKEDPGVKKAKAFIEDLKREFEKARDYGDVGELLRNLAMQKGLFRLKSAYDDLYKGLTRWCVEPEHVEKMTRGAQTYPTFGDDVAKAYAERSHETRQGKAA